MLLRFLTTVPAVNDDQRGVGGAVNRERRSWKVVFLGAEALAPQNEFELRLTTPEAVPLHFGFATEA